MRQLKGTIKLLDKQLEQLDKTIEKHVKSKEEVATKVENICVIKGLGILTVATVLAETNGFELFENQKQLISYAGYDVVEKQSGGFAGKTRISKKGNSRIRRALFFPAFSVVTHKQTAFYNLYCRLAPKHPKAMIAYVAIQKKILVTIYALWKKNEAYDNNYIQKIQEEKQEFRLSIENELVKKNSPVKDRTTLGKYTTNEHSMLPVN